MKCIYYILLGLLVSCSIPNDSNKSWEKAQTEGLIVGVIDNPPYATKEHGTYKGTEIKHIKEFAQNHQIKVVFHSAHASDLFKDLEKYRYSLVLGGIEKNNPWKSKIAFTKPYDKKHVFAIPKGENELLFKLESFIHKTTP